MPSRVCIFRHQLFKPTETFIAEQARAFNRYEPIYLGRERAGDAPPNVVSFTLEAAPKITRIWHTITRDPSAFLPLLDKHHPALVHAHFGVDAVYALPLASQLQVPLVTTFHGFDATTAYWSLLTSGRPAWINYALQRRKLAKSGHTFLCVSEFIRRRVLALGFPESRTLLHYVGVDVDRIRPITCPSSSNLLVHVARLVPKKGTRNLIEAAAFVLRKHRDARLVIIGDGPLRNRLELLARERSVGDQITFLGVRPHREVLDWIGRAAVVAVPSITAQSGDSEGLPIVLLEAAARGVPVVATVHAGIPEAVVDGSTGFLVRENDIAALQNRLDTLLGNVSLRTTLGAAARELATEKFNLTKQSGVLEQIYSNILR